MSPCPVRVPYETLLQNLDFGTLESIWNAKTLQHQLTSGCYKWNRYPAETRSESVRNPHPKGLAVYSATLLLVPSRVACLGLPRAASAASKVEQSADDPTMIDSFLSGHPCHHERALPSPPALNLRSMAPLSSKQAHPIINATPRAAHPIQHLLQAGRLIKQGAEAKVYKTILFPTPTVTQPLSSSSDSITDPKLSHLEPTSVLLKHRFPKQYRHPTLDLQLTRTRLTAEARSLVRCLKAGVVVPALRLVDTNQGVLGLEWIEGNSIREVLGGSKEEDEIMQDDEDAEHHSIEELWRQRGLDQGKLMPGEDSDHFQSLTNISIALTTTALLLTMIGESLAAMHLANIIHGDLTTSNMMVRQVEPLAENDPSYQVVSAAAGVLGLDIVSAALIKHVGSLFQVLIDFGLSSVSPLPEDRAVDLYVVERAFASTHPVPLLESGQEGEPHFTRVLQAYMARMKQDGKKDEGSRVEKRLDEVRMRGRKRSMVG
ncbi:BZ3500_MvSof-1268-A1-R1_Chr1-3g02162 [Microbotryum saponariae]|uniref:non-specific serine/threonine protein kinase n=1 Tax=Microbotryum saponariae TaxID=289078 RepID=A0A2X0KCS7_9BASI|nr:BZ3500_MvSof-1268-A1-R1_Chr1-3g02162 [Microbotryum saponariae]SCZ95544.1 BZ3501_MvSof-1269-A2-R1_Chr1-3g01765 [Microbotryum saponariae]